MHLLDRAFPQLVDGLRITLLIGFTSFAFGAALGLALALARVSAGRPLRLLAVAYVSVFRGTPLLVQILLIYFGLPQLGVTIEAIPSAILALSLNAASYLSENFRAGILGVDRGQREAASSLGMGYARAMWRIILPQAARIALPGVGNRFIALMKDTSLASVVTVVELTRVAERVGSATFQYMEMFVIVAVVYWLVNTTLSVGQEALERRLARAY
ncbi:MAG: amino acid ABC transporter permease [Chloroflexi bacterium]|nr:amino acid ABC transporter permease [Chloroflexota bacterium]